jgi:hypothetical protein
MAKLVGSIESISSCSDWWSTTDGIVFDPVACWAVLKIVDTDYVSLGPNTHIVGIIGDELGGELSIDGDILRRQYNHRDDFVVVGQELKDDYLPRGGG